MDLIDLERMRYFKVVVVVFGPNSVIDYASPNILATNGHSYTLCQQRTVCSPAYDHLAYAFSLIISFVCVGQILLFEFRFCLFSFRQYKVLLFLLTRSIFFLHFFLLACVLMGSFFLFLISKFLENNLISFSLFHYRISCCVYIPLCPVCSDFMSVGFVADSTT